jgi:membrane protein DedA with SNARE-associated domain
VGLIGDALHWLAVFAKDVLESTGYLGLFLLMAAESMILPVPSEAVMPFAGYLAAQGTFDVTLAILASSAGSLFGSYLGYWMGQHGLLPLVRRWGKYVLVGEHHVVAAQRYFERRGAWAVFLCRFIPGVRHIVSIPAGAARMRHGPFIAATLVGATAWNVILFWIGYRYGEAAAEAVKPHLDLAGIALLVLIAAYVAYEVWQGRRDRRREALESAQAAGTAEAAGLAPAEPHEGRGL